MKMTNPVILETSHYQISDDLAELMSLEMAEIKESGVKSKSFNVRINAIHAGTTKNFHTFLLDELETSKEKWTKPYGKPILKNHDIFEEPLGRIKEADVLHYSEADGVLSVVASISDIDAMEKIKDQRYVTVSVGVMAKDITCSVCGKSFLHWGEDEDACDHFIGKEYDDEDGNKILCTAVIRGIDPVELSFVNLPADQNDERFAGVVHIGESEGFEFFADGAMGEASKGKKKKSVKVPDNIALALKESWDEFLELFDLEGDESQMGNEDTQKGNIEEEESLVDDELLESEEEEKSVEDLEEEEVTEEDVSDNDIDLIESYFSNEADDQSEEDEEINESSEENEPEVEVLQTRISELENEVTDLSVKLNSEVETAGRWISNARMMVVQHIADIKFILNKLEGNNIKALEEGMKDSTFKELLSELKELRKELLEKDPSTILEIKNNGILKNEPVKDSLSNEDRPKMETLSQRELISSFTSSLLGRPYKEGHKND